MELDLIGKKIVGTRSSPLTSHFFLSLSVQKYNLVKMLNRTCHLTSSIHCFSQWGGRHLFYYFHSLCTHWEPFYFSPGKLVPRGFWERETNAVQWKPWSSTTNGENCYNLWSRLRENGPFCRCYPWKGFIPRSVAYLDKLSRKYSCKSLECWPCFTLCATTLASNILQVSLGTCHYLCRGEGGIEGGSRLFQIV